MFTHAAGDSGNGFDFVKCSYYADKLLRTYLFMCRHTKNHTHRNAQHTTRILFGGRAVWEKPKRKNPVGGLSFTYKNHGEEFALFSRRELHLPRRVDGSLARLYALVRVRRVKLFVLWLHFMVKIYKMSEKRGRPFEASDKKTPFTVWVGESKIGQSEGDGDGDEGVISSNLSCSDAQPY